MTFWVIAGGLTLLCVWLLLQPALSKSPRVLARRQSALAILEDQLAEVKRDADRAVLSRDNAAAAELEIKRRMISLGSEVETDESQRGRGADCCDGGARSSGRSRPLPPARAA
ncbi:MAG: hypothetical protein AcusKO_42740 [Acuticoccus sp.]